MTFDVDASAQDILRTILSSGQADRDGFRMSHWSGFYTNPVFVEIERRFGLLRDENNILFCLVNFGPLTATRICEVLGRPKNSVSRAVERLLHRKLISRSPARLDRRRLVLVCTDAGRSMYEQTAQLFLEREAFMLRSLSPVERVALDQILGKLMDASQDWMGPLSSDEPPGGSGRND